MTVEASSRLRASSKTVKTFARLFFDQQFILFYGTTCMLPFWCGEKRWTRKTYERAAKKIK